jgi:hypothetical protein
MEGLKNTEQSDNLEAASPPIDPGMQGVSPGLEKLEVQAFGSVSGVKRQHLSEDPPAKRQRLGEDSGDKTSAPAPEAGDNPPKSSLYLGNPVEKPPRYHYRAVVAALTESKTTFEDLSEKYFTSIHQWLPIINSIRFKKELQQFKDSKDRQAPSGWLLTVSAMHLLVTPPSEHPPAPRLAESRWYVACKAYFGVGTMVADNCDLAVAQAGMLIALFEHTQRIENRALLTLGVSARVAHTAHSASVVSQLKAAHKNQNNLEDTNTP